MPKKIEEIFKEIKEITWPNRQRVINDTVIVGVALAVGTVMIAFIDKGFFSAFQSLIALIQK